MIQGVLNGGLRVEITAGSSVSMSEGSRAGETCYTRECVRTGISCGRDVLCGPVGGLPDFWLVNLRELSIAT